MNLRDLIRDTERGNAVMLDLRNDLDTSKIEGKHKFGFADLLSAWKRRAKFASSKKMNPIAPGLADIVNWILYDRNNFAAGATVPANFKFYTQPIGTANKTKADTNLDQVQRLPDPLWMNALGIGFRWNETILPADILTFSETFWMEFWVGQKDYVEGPFTCFPAASGIQFTAAATTVAATTIQPSNNGQARIDNMFDLRLPAGIHLGYDNANGGAPILSDGLTGITILQGQQFRIECNGTAFALAAGPSGVGMNLQSFIYGILSRGVQ